MAIALDTTGGGAVTASSTSFNVDITAAATGADVFCWIAWGLQSASFTFTGWTQILVGGPASTLTCGLFYRRKVAGDTTFSVSVGSAKGCHAWASYTGLHSTTPYQSASSSNFLAKSSASVNVSTPAVTNSDATAWALGFFASRSSTSGNKVITFTPDAALTERKDQNNSGASSGIWTGVEIADSNAVVTAASHSYTAVASFSETFGGGALLYLNPAGGTTAIGKDLQLVWDVRAALGDTLQTVWDVRAAVADTLQLVWDVRAALGDTLALQWDVRAALGDTLQLVWDVQITGLSAIGKDLALIWNTRAVLGDTVQLVWNTRAAVADTVQLVWNTRAAVSDLLQLVWDTRSVIGDPLVLTWDVRAALGDQIQLVWNVRTAIGDTLQLVWDVQSLSSAIGKNLVLLWDTRAAAGDTLQLVWNVERATLYLTVPHHRNTPIPRTWRVPQS